MLKFETITDLTSANLAQYDAIIDVRSPAEFAEDHLPGAINLPVLNNDERAEIGTLYKQVSAFEARRRGAGLVARNIAAHLDAGLKDCPPRYRPLVYCWRGGMRSTSMAVILSAIGWRPALLGGGYRTWRRSVAAALESDDTHLPVILIDGQTGSGKTALLHALQALGEQVIDLEGLAAHRGSVFGPVAGVEQPSQKRFETCLWTELRDLDLSRPVFLEAESRMVGRRRVPERLWAAMRAAPRIHIEASPDDRAGHLLTAYPDLIADRERIDEALDQLIPHHGHEQINAWREQADRGDWLTLARALIISHYDPAYDRARRRETETKQVAQPVRLEAASLSPAGISDLAERVQNAGRALLAGDHN